MACDAGIIPAVYGSDSQILDFGRLTRTIPAGLRRYIVARDGGCVFPGCDRPPAWSEVHHSDPWAKGGETNADLLALLCVHHHQQSAMKAAGNSPSAPTQTAPPGSTHPTADHRCAVNAGHSSDPPPTHPDARESAGSIDRCRPP